MAKRWASFLFLSLVTDHTEISRAMQFFSFSSSVLSSSCQGLMLFLHQWPCQAPDRCIAFASDVAEYQSPSFADRFSQNNLVLPDELCRVSLVSSEDQECWPDCLTIGSGLQVG